jgi:hypothetical protein
VSLRTYVIKWSYNSHHCHLPQIKSPHPPPLPQVQTKHYISGKKIPSAFFIDSALWQFKKHKSHLITVAVTRIAPLLLYERAYFDHWFLFDWNNIPYLGFPPDLVQKVERIPCFAFPWRHLFLRRQSHLAYLFLRHFSMLTFLSCSEPITTRIALIHYLNDICRLRKTPLGANYTNCRTQSK